MSVNEAETRLGSIKAESQEHHKMLIIQLKYMDIVSRFIYY